MHNGNRQTNASSLSDKVSDALKWTDKLSIAEQKIEIIAQTEFLYPLNT